MAFTNPYAGGPVNGVPGPDVPTERSNESLRRRVMYAPPTST